MPNEVDVIIPTRNRPELTSQAVASVVEQVFTNWRLLVVDDASDPASLHRLREVLPRDPRIELIERREPGGGHRARQTGFEMSSSEYVATLDSDDLWEPPKLSKQVEALTRRGAGFGVVLTWHRWTDLTTRNVRVVQRPRFDGSVSPLASSNMSSLMARREAITATGGFEIEGREPFQYNPDIEFYVRLSAVTSFCVVPELLVTCRDHGTGRDGDLFQTGAAADELIRIYDVHRAAFDANPEDRSELHGRAAARYASANQWGAAVGSLRRALAGTDMAHRRRLMRRYVPYIAALYARGIHRQTTQRLPVGERR